MPKILDQNVSRTFDRERHCTRLVIDLPVGNPAQMTATAHFTRADVVYDGEAVAEVLEPTPDGSVVLNYADIAALPSFAGAYGQMKELVHAKRDEQEAEPEPEPEPEP